MLRSPAGLWCRRKRTHAIGVHPLPPAVLLPDEGRSNALHDCTKVKAPVSACKPLCAILLAKASVYPLSPAKANVDRFAGHCDKNFFAAWYPLMEVGKGGVTAFENPLKSV